MLNGDKIRASIVSLLLTAVSFSSHAQFTSCPEISLGPDTVLTCSNSCATLAADVAEVGGTATYGTESIPYAPPFPFNSGSQIFVNQDDSWSSIINLPFSFCFFGNTYTDIVIGANGVISFETSLAGSECEWEFTQSIPNTTGFPYRNSINGAYHDMDPSVGGSIWFDFEGVAPCRKFVVSWDNVPNTTVK